MVDTEKRIEEAVKEAENAFWEVIAEKFPEAETGDLYFDASIQFEDECESIARLWIATNTNLLPNHWYNKLDDEECIEHCTSGCPVELPLTDE